MDNNTSQKPPSNIRIRTLESDIEEMRNSGGQPTAGRFVGRRLEEVNEKKSNEKLIKKDEPLFEGENQLDVSGASSKKSNILPIIIGVIFIFILGGVSAYFVLSPKNEGPVVVPTVAPTPNHISLLKNPTKEKVFVKFNGTLTDFERVIGEEYKKNYEVESAKELVLLKDDINPYSANDFMQIVFSGFPGVNSSDIPRFEDNFSILVYNGGTGIQNRLAYLLSIDPSDLPSFAISNIKSKFSGAIEKLIEEKPDLLSSQYLENVGNSQKPFLTQEIGPVTARYLNFSAGSVFYYGWYQDYLLVATSRESFDKLLEAVLPKI